MVRDKSAGGEVKRAELFQRGINGTHPRGRRWGVVIQDRPRAGTVLIRPGSRAFGEIGLVSRAVSRERPISFRIPLHTEKNPRNLLMDLIIDSDIYRSCLHKKKCNFLGKGPDRTGGICKGRRVSSWDGRRVMILSQGNNFISFMIFIGISHETIWKNRIFRFLENFVTTLRLFENLIRTDQSISPKIKS